VTTSWVLLLLPLIILFVLLCCAFTLIAELIGFSHKKEKFDQNQMNCMAKCGNDDMCMNCCAGRCDGNVNCLSKCSLSSDVIYANDVYSQDQLLQRDLGYGINFDSNYLAYNDLFNIPGDEKIITLPELPRPVALVSTTTPPIEPVSTTTPPIDPVSTTINTNTQIQPKRQTTNTQIQQDTSSSMYHRRGGFNSQNK
jgi:hypothetical protein